MYYLQHNATFGQRGHHLALQANTSDESWSGEEGLGQQNGTECGIVPFH